MKQLTEERAWFVHALNAHCHSHLKEMKYPTLQVFVNVGIRKAPKEKIFGHEVTLRSGFELQRVEISKVLQIGLYKVPHAKILEMFREETEKRAGKESGQKKGLVEYREFFVYTRTRSDLPLTYAFACTSELLKENSLALKTPSRPKKLALVPDLPADEVRTMRQNETIRPPAKKPKVELKLVVNNSEVTRSREFQKPQLSVVRNEPPAFSLQKGAKQEEKTAKEKFLKRIESFVFEIETTQSSTKQMLAAELRRNKLKALIPLLQLGKDSKVQVPVPAEIFLEMKNKRMRKEPGLNFQAYKRRKNSTEFEPFYNTLRVVKWREGATLLFLDSQASR